MKKKNLLGLFITLIFQIDLTAQTSIQGVLKYQQITWFTDSTDLLTRPVELFFNQSESMVKLGDAKKVHGVSNIPKMNDVNRNIIYKNLIARHIISAESAISERVLVKDTLMGINWIYLKETRKMGELICLKAEADYKGRHYTAWYTLDIPISTGPWKLYGLPGLIVEAYDDSKQVKFLFDSIVFSPSSQVKIEPPMLQNSAKSISYKQFLGVFKKNKDNQIKMMLSEATPDKKGRTTEANITIKGIEVFPN